MTGKIDSEAVKDTIKKATDTTVNLVRSAKNLIVVCLAVVLLFKGCGATFGGSKGEKIAENIVSASCDCKIKSVTTIMENDKTEISIYVVKYIPSGEDEHSALVRIVSGTAIIDGVYSKKNYNELNKEIDSWKLINKINK